MEALRVRLPLIEPFQTAAGTVSTRDVVYVAVEADGFVGWAEAAPYPGATEDTADDVWNAILTGASSAMASAALENAQADADARRRGLTLAEAIGADATEPPRSLAVGLDVDTSRITDTVAAGAYGAVKLKVNPVVAAARIESVRAALPGIVVGADANGSFAPDDADHLAVLHSLDIAYLEQPFPRGRLSAHRDLRHRVGYPIALDEDVRSLADGIEVLRSEAADLLVAKPGVLGIGACLALHDAAVAAGLGIKASGFVESSIGRAYTNALARMRGASFSDVAPATAFLAVDPVVELPAGIGLGLDREAAAPFVVDRAVG